MSGIAGIYHLDGRPVEEARLRRMTAAIAHRGPDGVTHWREGAVGLGHCMLHTTAESLTETQPLGDETGDLHLTLDGRVDNREELRQALRAAGYSLRSDSDAELVLRAYACWGAACASRILGDFAFVVWDRRARQLVCGRDILGLRPFYYHLDGRTFRCGSELQQLLVDPAVTPAPNEGMIGEYLASAITDLEETLYRGLLRLPPAHILIVRPDGIRKQRYWDGNLTKEIRYRRDAEYAEHFRAVFTDAVRLRLRSHRPVGAELSGGLDSSSVVCVAQALRGNGQGPDSGLETFSLVFPGSSCDESAYSQDVVRRWPVTAHTVRPPPYTRALCLAQVRRWRDVPEYPNGMMSDSLRHLARQRGCRALLTGWGGDEWLTGHPLHLADLLRQRRIAAMVRQLADDARLVGTGRIRDAVRVLLTYGVWPLLPESVRPPIRWALGRPDVPPWIPPAFAKRIGLRDRLHRGDRGSPAASLAQARAFRDATGGTTVHVREIGERQAAWCGLELRHPFYDRRVVEFGLQIPEEQRWRGAVTKFVLREAMTGVLPESVRQRRTKAEFSLPFVQALRDVGAEAPFGSLTLETLGWIDGSRCRDMYRRLVHLSEARDEYLPNVWPLWVILGMELWVTTVIQTQADRGGRGPAQRVSPLVPAGAGAPEER